MTERFRNFTVNRDAVRMTSKKKRPRASVAFQTSPKRLGLDAACPGELALLKTLAAEDWPALCRTERHGCFLTAG